MATADSFADRVATRAFGGEVGNWALVALGALAAMGALLVGTSTVAALDAGLAGLALGTVAAVVTFTGAVAVFEAGRITGAGR